MLLACRRWLRGATVEPTGTLVPLDHPPANCHQAVVRRWPGPGCVPVQTAVQGWVDPRGVGAAADREDSGACSATRGAERPRGSGSAMMRELSHRGLLPYENHDVAAESPKQNTNEPPGFNSPIFWQ